MFVNNLVLEVQWCHGKLARLLLVLFFGGSEGLWLKARLVSALFCHF